MTCEEIIRELNPEQAEAVRTLAGPVLVLAGAGTGKTRVITYRIAYMLASGIPPENILGMTFTNKAAAEMRERLAQLAAPAAASAVTLGTFHSFCGRLLRREITKLGYLPNFTIADESDQLGIFKQAAGNIGCNHEGFPLAGAMALIGRWKNLLLRPHEARQRAENEFESQVAHLYENYQEQLELQNAVDFDDMLLLVYRLFSEFPEVLERYRARYRYLLIDEYQDTNAAQFALVRMLAGSERNLCVVGDDDQSIYSWRGADIGNILDFPEHFPGARVIKLEQNYRSSTSILNAANAAIAGGNIRRHSKKLWSSLGEGELPRIVLADDSEGEADFIGAKIEELRADHPELSYRDFAILYRSNQLSRQFEQALRNAQIPYRIFGGQQFYQRREIKDAVAYLRLLVNPADDQSLLRILAAPPRGIGAKVIEELKIRRLKEHRPMLLTLIDPEFNSTLSKAARTGASELGRACAEARAAFAEPGNLTGKISAYLDAVGYIDGLQRIYKDIKDTEKRRDNVDEFISAVAMFEKRRTEPASLADFLDSFALLEENAREDEEDNQADAVVLSTIHASKGLEFPVVFITALERGIFPHERALAEGGGGEERRLFYVALTRAKRFLYLLRARARVTRGVRRPAQPSEFLAMLPDTLVRRDNAAEALRELNHDELNAAFENIFKLLRK